MAQIERLTSPYSYSVAVQAGDYVFVGLHRGFGETFGEQFDSAFAALRDTLAHFDLELESLVKVHVWLKHVQDLPDMEKRFHSFFQPATFPARMTATTEFVDADCLMMIEGTAYRGAVTPCPSLEQLLAQAREGCAQPEQCVCPPQGEEAW